MSAAGVPMFYGAIDENTAFAETFNPIATTKNVVSFGIFRTTRPASSYARPN